MQNKDFRFSLRDADGNYWQVALDGTIDKNSTPYYLQFSPDGWDEISISNIRNKKYWGIDRSVTIPLSYVNDAAHILKYVFYTLGIEESVYLYIESQVLDFVPEVSYGYRYQRIYRGEVDLSTFQHAGAKVTCTALEDGLPKFLKANENTVYEFPMNVSEAVFVKLDGINLHEKLNYQDTSDTDIHFNVYGNRWYTPTYFINNEGDSVGIVKNSQFLQDISGTATWDDILASDNFLIKNVGPAAVSVTIKGTIEYKCTAMVSSPPYSVKIRFLRSNQLLANQNDYEIISTGLVVGTTYTQDYEITVPLDINEKLFLEGSYFGGVGSDAAIAFTANSKFGISFITRQSPTYIEAFRPQYLFGLLIDKVTEGNYTAETSPYFTTYKNVVFTSGNAIRSLKDADNNYIATMKISFSDFFKFWDSFDAVGIIERLATVGFDSKVNLIDLDNIIELPEVAHGTFKVSTAKEYLFNELQIGYPELKNDVGVLNGNEEFNTKFIFSLGTTKSPAQLDKISPVKASCYEIEKIRVTTFEKNTTDYKADNDNFVLHIGSTVFEYTDDLFEYYELDRILNAGATGLIEPATVYNLFLSIKRNLLRNGGFINSSLYIWDTKTLKFISADKNNKLVSDGVVEKADVVTGDLDEAFFKPIYFDFNMDAPDNLLDLLDANPLQIVSFPLEGNTYKGIVSKVGVSPSNRKEQAYQLLSINQDITALINYYGG